VQLIKSHINAYILDLEGTMVSQSDPTLQQSDLKLTQNLLEVNDLKPLDLQHSSRLYGSIPKSNTYNTYKGGSTNSRTVLLSKHTETVKNQNYYDIVEPLLYITYHGFTHDVLQLLRYK